MLNTIKTFTFASNFRDPIRRGVKTRDNSEEDSNSQLKALINNMGAKQAQKNEIPCIEFTHKGYISYVKTSFASFLGMKDSAFTGKHFSELIIGGTEESIIIRCMWSNILAGEKVEMEFSLKTMDGTKVRVQSYFEGIKNNTGNVYKVYLKMNQLNTPFL